MLMAITRIMAIGHARTYRQRPREHVTWTVCDVPNTTVYIPLLPIE